MAETDGASGNDGAGSAGADTSDNSVSEDTKSSVNSAMSEARDNASDSGNSSDTGADAASDDGAVDDMTEDDARDTQDRMEAEGKAAKESFDRQQEARAAADQSYADALDQEVAAQNQVAEETATAPDQTDTAETDEPAPETATPGTFEDTHVAQGLSGVNEGIANVLGGPVDLVEMGLNGVMSAAEFVGVPESWTPEFEGSFLGSDHIKDIMTDTGSIVPESADPAKQTTRDVAEVSTEVAAAVIGAGALTQGRTVVQQADDVLSANTSRVPDAVDLDLKYKDGWTDTQRAAADAKAQALTDADTVVTPAVRSGTSASQRYARDVGPVPQGMDVDHIQELQLGGADEIINMSPLDRSVNRSFGSQIQHQIKDLEVGTPVNNVTIRDR